MKIPTVLCVLDGWGVRSQSEHNAINQAETPNWDRFMTTYPNGLLEASGEDVGLPKGQMGNSEVGHMTIGAGRAVLQDLPKIDRSIKENALKDNSVLNELISALKESGGVCHLMGLISPGGVHSHHHHINALIDILLSQNINVCLHAFMDGRDTPPKSGHGYMESLLTQYGSHPLFNLVTISGRYYAMDRDNRWERIEQAYDVIVKGVSASAPASELDPLGYIKDRYDNNETDEFLAPTSFGSYQGISDGDAVLCANFRADRVREILTTLTDDTFTEFTIKDIQLAYAAGMTEYSEILSKSLCTLFPSEDVKNSIGEIISAAGMTQMRMAETEKYAHVTFFLNGGCETAFEGEARTLIPSPKVATYDLKPEMAAYELTDSLCEVIESGAYDLIVVNYANADMVGHTGNLAASIKAVEVIDSCLEKIEKSILTLRGNLLITSDHGNAETMYDPVTGQAHTAHTLNLVPFVHLANDLTFRKLRGGSLIDIAPTLLKLINIDKPIDMTGDTLI